MIQNILYILCHYGVHLRDVLCQLCHVSLRPCVHVQLLCLLNEGICTLSKTLECSLMVQVQADYAQYLHGSHYACLHVIIVHKHSIGCLPNLMKA